MNRSLLDPREAMDGALVADAATMGLHWMYDQEQIKKIELTGDVLFRQPDAAAYEGKKAYFAHAAKKAGEQSQYGQCVRVVAEVIAQHGSYSITEHQKHFFDTFGPCGSYHGFADRPTKALVARIINDGEELAEVSGSDDDQMPALCSVPALFASGAHSDDVTRAVLVTNNNEQATSGAQVLFDCLSRVKSGESLHEALQNSAALAHPNLLKVLKASLALEQYDPLGTAQHFSQACHMEQGLPVAWHLLRYAEDFETVVRDNVRCGGDSCGRAMAVGSIAGLVFGVPAPLKAKVDCLK